MWVCVGGQCVQFYAHNRQLGIQTQEGASVNYNCLSGLSSEAGWP